jgi:TRAP-type C4-dicarboxylate transport system permease small subunit
LTKLGTTAGITGGGKTLPEIIGSIVNVVLGFLGIVFLVLLLYAGFMWMTAQGDDKKVDKARAMISQSVIGLVIIVAAYAISTFVLGSLVNVTGQ